MGLLAALEKLITEHGSAAILRERLDAFRDDVQRLEQRNTQLEAENAKLETEKKDLREQLDKLKQPPTTPAWGSQPRIPGRMER
jgi:cell division protein FtsB